MTERERDDFRRLQDERHDAMWHRLDQIHSTCDTTLGLLREQNSRIGKVETRVSVLEERNPSAKPGGIAGAVGGFVSGLMAGWMRP